jgi:hypothetical protein
MAERALPAANVPRTVTVRVRSLGVVAGVAVLGAVVSWTLWWVTGLQPISLENSSVQPVGLTEVSGAHVGPSVYRVGAGHPRIIITFGFHNTASVPVTVTGVDAVGVGGPIVGPALRLANARTLEPLPGPFHAVRIPADGTRLLTLVYGISPHLACNEQITVPTAGLHFTTLGILGQTQQVPLGDQAVSVTGRCQ